MVIKLLPLSGLYRQNRHAATLAATPGSLGTERSLGGGTLCRGAWTEANRRGFDGNSRVPAVAAVTRRVGKIGDYAGINGPARMMALENGGGLHSL